MSNTYEIYQLKHDEALHYHRFEPLDRLHQFGLEVSKDNYDLVYTADNKENLSLEDIFQKYNMDRPEDFKGHSLSVSDIVVMKSEGEDKAFYCDSFGFTEIPDFLQEHTLETEVAVEIADRMISIQECEDGYDYTIYGTDYKEIDGGVYDNPDITIREALKDIIDDLRESHYDATTDMFYRTAAQGEIMQDSVAKDIDYDELLEKVEQVAAEQIKEAYKPNAAEIFKQKTHIIGFKKWFSTENDQQFQEISKMWDAVTDETCQKITKLSNNDGVVGLCADMYDGGFDYWIGCMSDKECPKEFEEKVIPASTWAVFEVIGPIRPLPNSMQDIWKRIYSEWFPNSGYEHAMLPEIEYYSSGDAMAADYRSEIWIPVKSK